MMHGHATLSGPLNRKIEARIAQARAARAQEQRQRQEPVGIEKVTEAARQELERLDKAIAERKDRIAALDRIIDYIAPIERIIQAVCRHYNLTKAEMLSWRRTGGISTARQVAMYLCRKLTGKSFPEIGRRMGGRDHSTIIHGASRIEALMKIDADLRSDIEALTIVVTAESSDRLLISGTTDLSLGECPPSA